MKPLTDKQKKASQHRGTHGSNLAGRSTRDRGVLQEYGEGFYRHHFRLYDI
jgi:hypothetical protein